MASADRDVRAGRSASTLADDAVVERVLDAVGCLQGRTGWERVSGGLTNVNVRVHLPDGDAIARIATQDSALLAIDRAAEHLNSVAAAVSGAAPAVLGYEPAAGVLVVRWVVGRTYSPADVAANLPRIAAACRLLHSGPRFGNDFDMFAVQRGYLDVVREKGFRLPPRYLDFLPAFDDMRRALAVRATATVPCNNDLLAENFVDDGRQVWIIDYEYGGNNDACFELGNIWSESTLPVEALDELVTAYYGRASAALVARARLLGLASKYGWTLWASIQDGASTLDFDFWSWGMEKYERAVAEFDGPDFARLLEEAAAPD
ncbi:choline/ethanolamine kinase family protein [Kineosporia sp. R_H_3]|uniref:choline/ethanolamine kinase family protein n=1 Tax=Kineosporia sp. R_H_3 TaxID=1961848 RepID=UPI0018E9464A|nr:choline/ethanolamine kinase family protein [Kineosporia sp. R_H_3]